MNEADVLARRVADTLLQREGTGPAWGVRVVRSGNQLTPLFVLI